MYLRGRYEVQIETDSAAEPPSHHTGGVYGFIAPVPELSRSPDVWQTFDIELIGRKIKVIQNGKTVIDNQEIPGLTGGALDSHEDEPGPIYFQGSEKGHVAFRNITIARSKLVRISRNRRFQQAERRALIVSHSEKQRDHAFPGPDLFRTGEAVGLPRPIRKSNMVRCFMKEEAMTKKRTATSVTVNQVSKVELTKRGSQNSLEIEVRRGADLLGTLFLGSGSVQWWLRGNKANKFQKSWQGFADLLDAAIK